MDSSERLDAKIADLLQRDLPVTLNAIGNIEDIPSEWASSPMFPYAANAISNAWHTLSDSERDRAVSLIESAITDTKSAMALYDNCIAIVPLASDLGIDIALKDALSRKATARTTPEQGALAAVALRWLTHLAVNAHTARPALLDVLVSISRHRQEPMPFAIAAAQAAGIAYDHWREQNAKDCLERLTDTDAEADAWFGLGQARLVDALEEDGKIAVIGGLRGALDCFERAGETGENRSDAALYSCTIRFVTELVRGASVAELARHVDDAESALGEYVLGGLGLPEQPVWLRPRYTAENAWIVTIQRLHHAMDDEGQRGHPWYQPAVVIGALSRAYEATNRLCPLRHSADAAGVTSALPDLVSPLLTAPFLEKAERLALVDRWLEETDDPHAEEFSQLVYRVAREQVDGDTASSQGVPPK